MSLYKYLFLVASALAITANATAQSLSVTVSGENGCTKGDVFNIVENNPLSFRYTLDTNGYKISSVKEIYCTFDGKRTDITDYELSEGTLAISATVLVSGNATENTKEFEAVVTYYVGDYVNVDGKMVWDDKAHTYVVKSNILNVKVWSTPSTDFANMSISTYMTTGKHTWSVNTTGGNPEGWDIKWIYGDVTVDASDMLPEVSNFTQDIMTRVINCRITNYAPDNKTVWFTTDRTVEILVYPEIELNMTGNLSPEAFGTTNTKDCTWNIYAVGGNPEGWKYEWIHQGNTISTESVYQLAERTNRTSNDETLTITAKATNTSPDGASVWFENTQDITVTIHPLSSYTLSGAEVRNVYINAEGLTWNVQPEGGNPEGWDISWSLNGTEYSSDTFTTPALENNGNKRMQYDITLQVRNYAPDKSKLWFSDTKNLRINIYPKAKSKLPGNNYILVQESPEIEGKDVECRIETIGGNDNGWKYKWTFNGATSTENVFKPKYNNTTNTKQVMPITVEVRNCAPDNEAIVWYSETFQMDLYVLATPFINPNITINNLVKDGPTRLMGYAGEDVSIHIDHGAYDSSSEWTHLWTLDSNTITNSLSDFSFTLPDVESTKQFSIEAKNQYVHKTEEQVDDTKELDVRYGLIEKEIAVYTHGSISKNPADSTDVYAGKKTKLNITTIGGYPQGWTFKWTDNGKDLTTNAHNLEFTAINNTKKPENHVYTVSATNKIGNIVGSESSLTHSTLTIWPTCVFPNKITMDDAERKRQASLYCIREGNEISLSVETPTGGYMKSGISNNVMQWTIPSLMSSNAIAPKVIAKMQSSGTTKSTSVYKCALQMTNYGPANHPWDGKTLEQVITVYRKPQTPSRLTKMGNGSTCTYIATIPVPDDQLTDKEYYLVFGYEDAKGDHDAAPILQKVGTTRYYTFPKDVYRKSGNKFYVYALWIYGDGSKVTSGKRYESSVNERWDGSVFKTENETRAVEHFEETATDIQEVIANDCTNEEVRIYTLDGQLVNGTGNLPHGIYIKENISGKQKTRTKFTIK